MEREWKVIVQMMLFLRSLQDQSHYCHKQIGPQDSGSASYGIQQVTPYQALALLELFQLGARAQPNKRLPQMLPRLKIVMMLASAIQTLNIGKSRKPFLRKPRLLQWIGLALSAEAVLVKWSWNTLSPGDSCGEFDLPSQFVFPVDLKAPGNVVHSNHQDPGSNLVVNMKKPYESYYNMRCIYGYTCLIIYA